MLGVDDAAPLHSADKTTSSSQLLLAIVRRGKPAARVAGRDFRPERVELRLKKSFATISAFTASRASPPQAAMAWSAAWSKSTCLGRSGFGLGRHATIVPSLFPGSQGQALDRGFRLARPAWLRKICRKGGGHVGTSPSRSS